jgi:hypothetical protein
MLYIFCSVASEGISTIVSGVAVMALDPTDLEPLSLVAQTLNMPDDFHSS